MTLATKYPPRPKVPVNIAKKILAVIIALVGIALILWLDSLPWSCWMGMKPGSFIAIDNTPSPASQTWIEKTSNTLLSLWQKLLLWTAQSLRRGVAKMDADELECKACLAFRLIC